MAKKKTQRKKAATSTAVRTAKRSGVKAKRDDSITLHIFSVATGGLANQIVNAVMTQFPDLKLEVRTHTYIDSAEKIFAACRGLKGRKHWIFHALIDQELKQCVIELCEKRSIPHYDMTGQLIDFIADHSNQSPINEVDDLDHADDGYFQRMDALEFSLQHDDSRRLESVDEADIILVGLSRVSKTPTSIFLGYMGFRVANVSIAPEVGLPRQLRKSHRSKVVALTIRPKKLQEIRQRRMALNRFDQALSKSGKELNYVDIRSIIKEVMYAEKLYRERGFALIDITDQTVEATALEVLEALDLSRPLY